MSYWPIPVEQRFWSKVDQSGGPDACWPWTAGRFDNGYGAVKSNGRQLKASRVAYELTFGPLGDRLALHHCDNPPCCNPSHLWAGTHADNAADRNQKGRQSHGDRVSYERRTRGSAHPDAKLTEAQVACIRAELRLGRSLGSLSKQYGVAKSGIVAIRDRRTWKHVLEEAA